MKYILKTKAHAIGDGKKYTYQVLLRESTYPQFKSVVLVLKDTPGQWYLSTLLGRDDWSTRVGDELSISGNDWYCTNMNEIMREVEALIGTVLDPKDLSFKVSK